LIKNGNDDLLADSHNILNRRKSYFSQLMNVHRVSAIGKMEIRVHTAEPLASDPSSFEVELVIAKLKKYTYKPPVSY
jgi:hypothetical protein